MHYDTTILGHECYVDFDYNITERGYPDSYDEPGAPMEFEITYVSQPVFYFDPERKITLTAKRMQALSDEIETSSGVYNDISAEV